MSEPSIHRHPMKTVCKAIFERFHFRKPLLLVSKPEIIHEREDFTLNYSVMIFSTYLQPCSFLSSFLPSLFRPCVLPPSRLSFFVRSFLPSFQVWRVCETLPLDCFSEGGQGHVSRQQLKAFELQYSNQPCWGRYVSYYMQRVVSLVWAPTRWFVYIRCLLIDF